MLSSRYQLKYKLQNDKKKLVWWGLYYPSSIAFEQKDDCHSNFSEMWIENLTRGVCVVEFDVAVNIAKTISHGGSPLTDDFHTSPID
jgi:hypothetical protein